MSLDTAMRIAASIAAIGIVWDAVELITTRADVLGRFFEWPVVRSRYYILLNRPVLGAIFDSVLSGGFFDALVLGHAVAAIGFVIVMPVWPAAAVALAALVLFGHVAVHVRLLVGLDGADQMQTVVWAGLLVYSVNLSEATNVAAAVFVTAQSLLSYQVAGWAKVCSKVWRGGRAVGRISRTGTYCTPRLSRILQWTPASFVLSWMTIGFEVLGAAALLAGRAGTVAFIAAGLMFHVGIALGMGLATFVFAFVAAFPILYALMCRVFVA
jgi:hypothetical protein